MIKRVGIFEIDNTKIPTLLIIHILKSRSKKKSDYTSHVADKDGIEEGEIISKYLLQ